MDHLVLAAFLEPLAHPVHWAQLVVLDQLDQWVPREQLDHRVLRELKAMLDHRGHLDKLA